MLGYYDYTVILTYISLTLGITGIGCCMTNHPFAAAMLLLVCGLCDAFDGKVARTKKNRTTQERNFGIQIDSLCDLVSFGVLPAAIGMNAWTFSDDIPGLCWVPVIGICAFYVLAGVIRLGYFNVTEEERQSKSKEGRKAYQGLPITMASLTLPEIFMLSYAFSANVFRFIFLGFLLLLGILFISPFEIKKPKGKALWVMVAIGTLICAGMVLVVVLT